MVRGVIYLFEYGVALLRIFLLISLVCFLPRLFFIRTTEQFMSLMQTQSLPCQLGSDIQTLTSILIKQWYPTKQEVKIAVITTNKDYTNIGNPSIDTVWWMEDLMALSGTVFGDQARRLCTTHDIILIDVPSVGLSCVASCHVLFDLLDNAAMNNIPVVLCDRPNMLGKKIEGPVCSFMRMNRCFKLPFRHGMTVAELAHYYNADVLENKVVLHIVPLTNYNRADSSWVQNFYGESYGVNVSALTICGIIHQIVPQTNYGSIGHQNCIMLPSETILLDQQWYQLQALLKELGITSFLYRYSDKDSDGVHRGLKLDNIRMDEVDCFRAILAVIDFFKTAGVPLIFSEQFDRLIGTSVVRHYAKGMLSKKKVFSSINKDLELFYRSAFAHFMYYPLPQLSLM